MNSRSLRWLAATAAALACLGLGGCGYNNLQRQDENVKAAWSEVVNQYQRRADLVPNLVNTVKGFAQQEQQVLIGVTEARAKVGSIQVSADVLNNPEVFAKYQAAQNQLTQSLKSLLAVSERYPDLKSNENFRDLQVQLEGTENRITVARNRYIDAVREYNIHVRSFPTNLTAKMFDFQVKPNFTVSDEQQIATAPTVDFGGGARPTGGPVSGPAVAPATPAPSGTPPPPGRSPVEPAPTKQ
jgi:LemA protein